MENWRTKEDKRENWSIKLKVLKSFTKSKSGQSGNVAIRPVLDGRPRK
jgi:hypothetical protein